MSGDDGALGQVDVAAADLARGRALADLGRFPEAARVLGRAAATAPTAETWCELARARLGAEDPAGALRAAQEACGLDPQAEWPHRLASTALSALDRHGEAVDAAAAAVRAAPVSWHAHACLAEAAAAVPGLRLLSLQSAEEAVRLSPDSPGPHHAMRTVAMTHGMHERAEAACRAVLALRPGDDAARNDLAVLSARRGGMRAATEGFLASAAAAPGERVYRDNVEVALWTWLRFLAVGAFGAATAVFLAFPGNGFPSGEVPLWLRAVTLAATVSVPLWAAFLARRLPEAAWPFLRHVLLARWSVRVGLGSLVLSVVFLLAAARAPAASLPVLVFWSRVASLVPMLGFWWGGVRASRRGRRERT